MKTVSRRTFVGGMGALIATGAAFAATGCSPKSEATLDPVESQAAATEHVSADEVIDADIVVVGAGCSGLAACVQAIDDGAKVVCLDGKSVVGGAAGGVEGLFAVDSKMQQDQGIEVGIGELIRIEMTQNQFRNDSLILRDLVKASGEDIDWLVDHGVRFGQIDNYVGKHPIFHWFETGTGAESYIVPMHEAAEQKGVEFILDTHADSLIQTDDGSVAGLYAKKTDGTVLQVNAKAVVLATGGYAERMDYLIDFGYTEENTVSGGMGGDGSGHDMAIACGGASYRHNTGILGSITVAGLPSFFEGGYFNQVMQPATGITHAIWVNESGERFVNEDLTLDNPMIGANPCRQHKGVSILLDESMMTEYVGNDEQGLKELSDALEKGIIVKAESWSELASSTGMAPEILEATIAQYNKSCGLNEDLDFGKASEHLRALADVGTVYAIQTKNSVGKTMGAIRTNRDFNVVNEEGEPIKGLYAAGVEGAMIWANVYTMNISGSCGAHNIYSGRTAVKHALANLV